MIAPASVREPVSFDEERLILVDPEDNVLGHDSKLNAHRGEGILHRAFSIFLFDGPGRVLLHQRSHTKPLWPAYWTNSCCSHPRRGETYQQATTRRLGEELGVNAVLSPLYRFRYHEHYQDLGSEHELCSVFVGNLAADQVISVNDDEIMAWDWFTVTEVDERIAKTRRCLPRGF